MQTTTKTTDLWQTPGPAAQVESSIRAIRLYNDDNRRLYLNAPKWERFIEAANDQPSHIRTFYLTLLYGSQKEHWLGWLREYNGPGAYGRQNGKTRDAQFAFNHGQCAPMLFWLAEALEMPDARLTLAYSAIIAAPYRGSSQCGALRKVIAWPEIENALANRNLGAIAKLRALVG